MLDITREAFNNVAVRARAGRCLIVSVAPPFRMAYWPEARGLVGGLGLPDAMASKLGETGAQSRLLTALADKGTDGAVFRPGRIGFSLGPRSIREREKLRERRRSVSFPGRCSREVVLGAPELTAEGLPADGFVDVRFKRWDGLADWDRGRESVNDVCAYLFQTRGRSCAVTLFSGLAEVPAGLWEFIYERRRVRVGWMAADLAGLGEMRGFEEWREGSIAFRNLERLGDGGLWPHILLPASATNVRLLPELTLALVEGTRGASIEIVPAPMAGLAAPSVAPSVGQRPEAGACRAQRSPEAPGVEDYVEALLAIYRDPRIPLRLVSPLSWVAARVNSETPMVSSLAAAGAEVAVVPDGSLYAGEQAVGLEGWRLGNALEDAREIRWERLDVMPEAYASSVKPERCLSCDWRWRCGGVDAAVMQAEEAARGGQAGADAGRMPAPGVWTFLLPAD